MSWIKKNVAVLTFVLGSIAALCSMTAYIIGSIHGVENRTIARMDEKFSQQDLRFAQLEKDITIIKTVLLVKGVLPNELAVKEEK